MFGRIFARKNDLLKQKIFCVLKLSKKVQILRKNRLFLCEIRFYGRLKQSLLRLGNFVAQMPVSFG